MLYINYILIAWGKINSRKEKFAEIKLDKVFGFTRTDRIAEVKQELDMWLIAEDMARHKL